MSKCFCHLNGYEVKDAKARKSLEETTKKVDVLTNRKIIVVTDSYGVPVREDEGSYGSWVDMLLQKYNGTKIASGGAGFVSYFNNRFINNLRAANLENKETYTDIIVAGGVNDAGDANTPITRDAISNAIIEFCNYCKINFPNAKIHIACIGGITPRSNLKERSLNLLNNVIQAYANTDADYSYCTFSESICFDRSLIINVHPNEAGHIEIYKYFMRVLNGECSFVKDFHSLVTLKDGTQVGFHGTINNGVAFYTGQRAQIVLGQLEVGPAFNFSAGTEVGTIDNNGILAVPSRTGYLPWLIMGSLYVARTSHTSLAYAGVGYLYPNEDGTKLMLQITSPDLVGGATDKIKGNFYFLPIPCVIGQTTT